ncbi:MAG TPA: EAL domain-containing protein [Geminicoccaceae bacterium]
MRDRLGAIWSRLTYGLARKLSVFMGVLLTVFTATLASVNILAEQDVIEDRLKRRARSDAAMLADFASNYLVDLRIDELRLIVQDVQRREDILYAYVLDADDRLIVDGEIGDDNLFDLVDDPLSREARARGRGTLMIDGEGLHVAEPVMMSFEELGSVRLGMSTDQMHKDAAAVRNRNLILGLVFLALSLALNQPLVRRITRPLGQLTASTQAASKGQFGQRIEIHTNDEIGTLATAFNRMLDQLRHHTAQIRKLAFFDAVTNLPNRVFLKEALARALADSRRRGNRAAVLFLDLDRFKLINDTFGHEAGDRLLKGFAERLSACVRASDAVGVGDGRSNTVARLGGDEFTIVLRDVEAPDDAAAVALRILDMLRQPFDLGGQSVVVGTSIGIALFPDDGDDPDALLKNADTAMYDAKEKGRNNLQFYSQRLSVRNLHRVTLERELRQALERDELVLHYQPQLDLRTFEVTGFEALLRWCHPERGLITPELFIPLAEETRLIVPIGVRVMRAACLQAREWGRAGLARRRVSVNLSMAQMQQDDFVAIITDILDETGLAPELLELEVTETMVMADPGKVSAMLAALRALGVGLAIDDFGTGYSSLAYLKRFAMDRLKIDRSFISDIANDADDEAIVTAIIAMAHNLKVEVVAEGVETGEQLAFLRAHGCDLGQGYLFSKPLPPEAVLPWLARQRARAPREDLARVAG